MFTVVSNETEEMFQWMSFNYLVLAINYVHLHEKANKYSTKYLIYRF